MLGLSGDIKNEQQSLNKSLFYIFMGWHLTSELSIEDFFSE